MIVRLGRDFDIFVRDASPTLLRTAFLLTGDRGHAEDLVQTALLRTARRWPVACEQPTAYARRVLVNLAKDRGRHLSRRPAEWLGPGPSTDSHYDLADPLAGVELRDLLVTAVRRLPMGQRTVLVLRYFEDLSVEETAGRVRSVGRRRAVRDPDPDDAQADAQPDETAGPARLMISPLSSRDLAGDER